MQVLNGKDYKLFERLVSLTQKEIKIAMTKYLRKKYKDNVIFTQDYLVAIGEIPIALVAHMDTVFKTPVSELYYDKKKGVLWSPQGLGSDDRAGIFAILKILQSGLRPSVILTTDEEEGGLGASMLSSIECPIPNLKYMIELDRKGSNDCVFYDCYCPEFIEYIEGFGFYEQWGSFSDISFLMSDWKICGVNLSVGYENEHSYTEILNIEPLFNTICKVKNMLQEKNIPNFIYNEINLSNSIWWKHNDYCKVQYCSCCNKLYPDYDLFSVKGIDDKLKYYCLDCIINKNVGWCEHCGEAFEISDPAQTKICRDCMEGSVCMKISNDSSVQ